MSEFHPAKGLRYGRFLRELHAQVLFDWYLEIGCFTGKSLIPVRSKTIAIDPYFRIEQNVIGAKPALHLCQQTSDDFFDSAFLQKQGYKLSFSFLDGMHLFEYLLRDFIGAEQASDPKGVIAMHDCCPFSFEMTTRDLDDLPRGAWTGDVWKLIPILKEYRPDLTVTVLDAGPTGLVLVTGLDPSSNVLANRYDEIVARYQDETLEHYGLERFYDSFSFSDARAEARAGYPLFQPVALPETEALTPRKLST